MFNKVILIGNLGRDAEARYMQDGENGVLNFTLATNKSWRDKDGNWQQKTQWHNIVFWSRHGLDYLTERLRKGTLAMVEGEVEYRQWEDKDGVTHYKTEIRAYKLKSLERRGEKGTSPADVEGESETSSDSIPPADNDTVPPDTEDDLPF